MRKICILLPLLICTMAFTACGTDVKNSTNGKQTKKIETIDLGSDPQSYILYGIYKNEEFYKDEGDSYADAHADDYDYMTLQIADSDEFEVQTLPVELGADSDLLNSDFVGKTDTELKEEMGLTDQQISILHEFWQYDHILARWIDREKESEDGEYSYSTDSAFHFAYEVVGDKLYMGLEAMVTDEENGGPLEYYLQDRKDWIEYSYGFDGLDLILS